MPIYQIFSDCKPLIKDGNLNAYLALVPQSILKLPKLLVYGFLRLERKQSTIVHIFSLIVKKDAERYCNFATSFYFITIYLFIYFLLLFFFLQKNKSPLDFMKVWVKLECRSDA